MITQAVESGSSDTKLRRVKNHIRANQKKHYRHIELGWNLEQETREKPCHCLLIIPLLFEPLPNPVWR